jgi:hypothetical protein
MNKLETCHHCGEEKENCYHGYIAMCIPIPKMEAQIEKWNLIDAYLHYRMNVQEYEKLPNKNDVKSMKMILDTQGNSHPSSVSFNRKEFNNKIKTDPEFLKKWFTNTWWKNLERTDLTEEESKELDQLATYDQLLNTVGRGVQCDDCGKKEAELYEIYYPRSLES